MRLVFLALFLSAFFTAQALAQSDKPSVLVYGATPAGIAAALAAADDGEKVLLIEPRTRIGGLLTNGLSHTDFRTFEGLNGIYLDFAKRVEAHYAEKYGKDSQQVKESFRGTFGEPKVNLLVLKQMIAERPSISLITGQRLASVAVEEAEEGNRITALELVDSDGRKYEYQAKVYVDGTYEGDLMAAAGVEWRAGREGKDEYGETLAPAEPDNQLQAYNFRFTMTKDPDNRMMPEAPAGYKREDFLPLLKILESGQIKTIFGYPSRCIYKAHLPVLPNGKYDINDVSNGLVRLSLPGVNQDWPNGDWATREKIFAEHLRDNAGMLYFLQNDKDVPKQFQDEAREWGWCKDEFTESGGIPMEVYVREARRMVGSYVYTEKDTNYAEGDVRSVLHKDSIAIGDYGNNCHGTYHEGPRFGGRHTGEFYRAVPPYQIPYGVLHSKKVSNLLVPTACSTSHVGFCSIRLEPIWTSLGQAAGHAAHLAAANNTPVKKVPVDKLQDLLHRQGAATVYISDVLPGHADYSVVQWWGTAGGFHGLAPTPGKEGPRGKNITGQYYEAFPNHAAQLEMKMTVELAEKWLEIVKELNLDVQRLPKVNDNLTRGDWLRAAYKANHD